MIISDLLVGWLKRAPRDLFSSTVNAGLSATADSSALASLATQVTAAQTSFEAFQAAEANALAKGGREMMTARNTAKANLVTLLRPLLSNINAIANGNVDILVSSGFPMRKTTRTPFGQITTPVAPEVTPGPMDGSLKAKTKKVPGASSYTARAALASAPTVYVQTVQSTKPSFVFNGLVSGELYNIEVSALGAAGCTEYSDPGSARPQ